MHVEYINFVIELVWCAGRFTYSKYIQDN